MKMLLRFVTIRPSLTVLVCLWGLCLLGNPVSAHAQCSGSPGQRGVYNSAGQACLGSNAYIDASALSTGSSETICSLLYGILSPVSYPAAGAVIDARGLVDGVNAKFTCASTESPWWNGSNYAHVPSVILLPAGTITISYTWVLPDRTKLVGQSSGSSTTTFLGTNIVVAAGTFTGPASGYTPPAPVAMIQFGDPGSNTCSPRTSQAGVCFHISVEDVTLNGSGQSVDGILNMDAQELSYARRVNLLNFAGTGLQIGYTCAGVSGCSYYAQAQNSGPYEQIYYSGSGPCAQLYGAGTRGIHGITCVATASSSAGILLDSESNSLEDVTISGYTDGIKIGSLSTTNPIQSAAWSNALFNIIGTGTTNLIHICGTSTCVPTSTPAPQDLTLLDVTSSGGTTILDDLTNTTVNDAKIGMYVLGEQLKNAVGYSRFATSPNSPAWFVGTAQLGSGTTTIACPNTAQGSIYSSTTGTAANGTLWGCIGGFWTFLF